MPNKRAVLILLGPNLNMLGLRDPALYGAETLADIEKMCIDRAAGLNLSVTLRQSNHEGDLVTWIQEARGQYAGLIINAAAYTHTSIAIHDALELFDGPIIEVHQSNPKTREPFRHHSFIEPLAQKVIAGKGPQGYLEALDFLAAL